jgi:hypothetical protein
MSACTSRNGRGSLDQRSITLLMNRTNASGHRGTITLAHRLARVSVGAAIALGAVLGLVLGIVVSVATDVPLAPEIGLVLGALVGWLSRRERA